MKEQLIFCTALMDDLKKNVKLYIANGGNNFQGVNSFQGGNWMNKNHGPTALKRKITLLRQELLNLERMIENV